MAETRIPEALALLREKGWCQRAMSRDGMHCIIGALSRVQDDDSCQFREDVGAIQTVIFDQYGPETLSTFNDSRTTTFADVEFVLEKAILERGAAL